MKTTYVSGRMRVLFDLRPIPLDETGELTVSSFVCKWCGWTAIVDEPSLIPDHECAGPPRARS
jgi:hypothetical protein